MKVRLLICTILATIFIGSPLVSAQTTEVVAITTKTPKYRDVGALEIELAGGIVSPTKKLTFDKNNLGWTAQGELRYNFKSLPLDLGLHVDGALFNREGEALNTTESLKGIAKAKFTSITGLGVIDLNLFRARGVSIFLGCGIGYGMLISDIREIKAVEDVDKLGCLCVMPRVGIELFYRVRATLYYKYFEIGQSNYINHDHFGASIGIVFGGGRK